MSSSCFTYDSSSDALSSVRLHSGCRRTATGCCETLQSFNGSSLNVGPDIHKYLFVGDGEDLEPETCEEFDELPPPRRSTTYSEPKCIDKYDFTLLQERDMETEPVTIARKHCSNNPWGLITVLLGTAVRGKALSFCLTF